MMPPSENTFGKRYSCAPWLRADTQVRPYEKYLVDCGLI